MPFENATRQKFIRLGTLAKPVGGGLTSIDLPRSGILSQIFLQITATVGGAPVAPLSVWGLSSIVRRVRVTLNSGIDVYNVTGPGYVWGAREMINLGLDPTPQNNGRQTVAAGTFNLDMVIPITMNNRDSIGAVLLQNETTLVQLQVEWETDTTVAAGAVITATCVPVLCVFEVPEDPKDWPNFRVLHQIVEDQQAIPGAGDYVYQWPRGNTYLGVYHTLQGTTWSQYRLRIQQSMFLMDLTPPTHRLYWNQLVERETDIPVAGNALSGSAFRIFVDFLSTDGMGAYGSSRDPINSAVLTDLSSVITAVGAGTLSSVRRQLVTLA